MYPARLFLAFCALASTAIVSQEVASSAVDPPKKRIACRVDPFGGVVAEIGPDWLELAPGWSYAQDFDGKGRDITKKRDTTKAKRISTAGTRPGGDPDGDGWRTSYRLTDLKVNDRINVDTAISEDGKEEWTIDILIYRRPGGIIPPQPGNALAGLHGWHLEMQAEQNWEEKGIPIPHQFLKEDGTYTWTNPPYPPVAPAPRRR